jgi:hypothetical protein
MKAAHNAVAQGMDEIQRFNRAPLSDHEIGPGTKALTGTNKLGPLSMKWPLASLIG